MSVAVPTAALDVPRPATDRWTLSLEWAHVAGLALFYFYMLMPRRVDVLMSVFTLDTPLAAAQYGIGLPYLTLLDFAMIAYAIAIWFCRPHGERGWRTIRVRTAIALYLAISLAAAFILLGRYLFGFEPRMWWDGVVAAVRLAAIYAFYVSIPTTHHDQARTVQNALAALFVSSFVLNLAGFANAATRGNEAGRMSVSGLDFATASYFGFGLALWSLTMSRGRRQAVLFVCGMLGGVMGGGRNALVLFVLALGFLVLGRRRRIIRPLLKATLVLAVIGVMAVVALPSLIAHLPAVQRAADDKTFYGSGLVFTDQAREMFPLITSLPLTEPAIVGRVNTWTTAILAIERVKGVPLASDWYVQEQLWPDVPSHSHNLFLQTFLKFSLLAIPFWLALGASLRRAFRAKSPYAVPLAFLLAGCFVDYWFLVIKATFMLFLLLKLNGDWIAAHRPLRRARVATA